MRLLADLHISPRTVASLRALGHDVVRVSEVLPATATDQEIVAEALRDDRTILTQDLDFSALVAVSGRTRPSVISLRLTTARIDLVNQRLAQILPIVQQDVEAGSVVVVEDSRIRKRSLPLR